MHYQILSKNHPVSLEIDVARQIEKGWKPQGGICAVQGSEYGDLEYLQAMITE